MRSRALVEVGAGQGLSVGPDIVKFQYPHLDTTTI